MREEIWRARHNLLTGQDSEGVKSVIKLLEQTYDRLQQDSDEATAAAAMAAANIITSLPKNALEVEVSMAFFEVLT